jgi:tetratricopeptide (TPR) repeat protein
MSWLADVVFYLTWSLGGLTGLSLLKGAFSVALVAVLWRTSRLKNAESVLGPLVGATIIVIALFALKFRFFLRPHLFELLLLPLSIHLLLTRRWEPLVILWLSLIQVFWVNLHGSFLVGLALPLVFAGTDLLGGLISRRLPDPEELKRMIATPVALILATLVNPRGVYVFEAPAQLARWGDEMVTLGEFQPLTLSSLTGFAAQYTWGFSLLVLLGLAVLAVKVLRRKPPDSIEIILFLLFLSFPLVGGVRFIAEFVVVSTPLLIRWWIDVLPAFRRSPTVSWSEIGLGIGLLPIWWIMVLNNPIYEVGLGEKEGKFPAAAVRFLDTVEPRGAVFNSIGFGGYLMWHRPDAPVFIDGRVPVYPRDFYRRYLDAHTDEQAWAEIETDHAPQVIVLEYLTDLSGKERMPVIEGRDGWALVFWDPVSKVYLKRGQTNDEIIAKEELRWARPNYHSFDHLLAVTRNPLAVDEAITEFRKLLEWEPANTEAVLGLAFVSAFGPDPDWATALATLRADGSGEASTGVLRIIECRALLGSGSPDAHTACAGLEQLTVGFDPGAAEALRATLTARQQVVQRLDAEAVQHSVEGRIEEAEAAFEEAIALDPSNPVAFVNRGLMWERQGELEWALEDFIEARRRASPGWTALVTVERLIRDTEASLRANEP